MSMWRWSLPVVPFVLVPFLAAEPGKDDAGGVLAQQPNSWVKRSPTKESPVSPGMGYETSLGYDPLARRVIRWGGHNQGGGGEQNAELWVLDPRTMKWELKEPNRSPPGVCCAQQNVFDPVGGRFLRFPAFSGNHGWHWFRENYLTNSTLWSYDLASNRWHDLRPVPAPRLAPLRCASWDSQHQVAVVFGGESSQEGTLVYDPHTNTWTRMRPKIQPAPRSGGNMTYDAGNRRHVLFGSQFTEDPHTWVYDLARNEWQDMKPEVQPPTSPNDAVLAYDPASQRVIALVRVADKRNGMEILQGHLETWAYDLGKNQWQRMSPAREPDGWGNRRRVLIAIPDQQVLLLEAYVNPTERVPEVQREQQIWTYRYRPIQTGPALTPPANLSVLVKRDVTAELNWKASPSRAVKGYHIYRGEGAVPWNVTFRPIARVDGSTTHHIDKELVPGKVYHYFLRSTDGDRESEDSIRVRTQPRIVEDAVVSVTSAKEVQLSWKPPSGEGVAGYHVERTVVEAFSEDQVLRLKKDTPPLAEPSVGTIKAIGPFVRLTREPLAELRFTDTQIDLGKPQTIEGEPTWTHRFRADQLDLSGKPYRFAVYAYRIRAVNAGGVEGGPSPYFLTIPSAPESLFAREEGDKCQLKWSANPEQGIAGYRVYRMEGPKINGPGQKVTRLTAEAVPGRQYTDGKAGKETKRFWVVAVDALGQEGTPSAPAWHYRQYRKYYEPFVGEWHQ